MIQGGVGADEPYCNCSSVVATMKVKIFVLPDIVVLQKRKNKSDTKTQVNPSNLGYLNFVKLNYHVSTVKVCLPLMHFILDLVNPNKVISHPLIR